MPSTPPHERPGSHVVTLARARSVRRRPSVDGNPQGVSCHTRRCLRPSRSASRSTRALGSALRPSCTRSCSRDTGRICSVTLACSHRTKYQYTVCHGGKSAGSCRHEHPGRTTYKIASTTARRGCFSGRPPRLDLWEPAARSARTARHWCPRGTARTEPPHRRRPTSQHGHVDTPTLLKHALRSQLGVVKQLGHVSDRMFAAVPAAAHALPRLGWGVLWVDRCGASGAPAARGAFAAQDRRVLAAQGDGLYLRAGFWIAGG
jgi:hypothetical protein